MKLRPKDISSWKYWLHLLLIAFIVLLILQLWQNGDMLTIKNVLVSGVLIGIADIISHTILGVD